MSANRRLVRHPRIYLDVHSDPTNALLVEQGRVVAVGESAIREAGGAELVEPAGACVMPALTDAHIHLWGLGLRPGTISLRDTGSPDGVYQRLRAYELDSSPSGWVLGTDWDQHKWPPGAALSRDRLDEIWPSTPVCLRRIDGHAVWANSSALAAASIADGWQSPDGGEARADASGRLTGELVDEAMEPVLAAIPPPSVDEDRATFLRSCSILLSHGITSAHIAWMPHDRLEMLTSLRDAGRLPVRIYMMFDGNDPNFEAIEAWGPVHDGRAWLSGRAVKFFADGAMGSYGAHLHDGYVNGATGIAIEPQIDLEARTLALAEAGWQTCVHAIGDAATTRVLDAFALVPEELRHALRLRVEHAQMATAADASRFAELGVIPSIQPIHMYSDCAWAPSVLAEKQLSRLFPWASFDPDSLAAGSDYPIEDPNPWHGIATAMSRRAADGTVFRSEHALSAKQAIYAYTEGAARAAFWEAELGSLREGRFADFIAVDRDPFVESASSIWDTRVDSTWIEGVELTDEGDDAG